MQKPQRGTGFVSAMGIKNMKGEMSGLVTGIGTIETSTAFKRANSKAALNKNRSISSLNDQLHDIVSIKAQASQNVKYLIYLPYLCVLQKGTDPAQTMNQNNKAKDMSSMHFGFTNGTTMK